jgi:hypothetical protein
MTEKFTCFGHVNDTRVDLEKKGISVGNCKICPCLTNCIESYDARVYYPDVDLDDDEDEESEEDEY